MSQYRYQWQTKLRENFHPQFSKSQTNQTKQNLLFCTFFSWISFLSNQNASFQSHFILSLHNQSPSLSLCILQGERVPKPFLIFDFIFLYPFFSCSNLKRVAFIFFLFNPALDSPDFFNHYFCELWWVLGDRKAAICSCLSF